VPAFLSEQSIPYEEINIENVDGAAEIVMHANQGAVPCHIRHRWPIRCLGSPFDRRKLSGSVVSLNHAIKPALL
jgi:hypothetical protein